MVFHLIGKKDKCYIRDFSLSCICCSGLTKRSVLSCNVGLSIKDHQWKVYAPNFHLLPLTSSQKQTSLQHLWHQRQLLHQSAEGLLMAQCMSQQQEPGNQLHFYGSKTKANQTISHLSWGFFLAQFRANRSIYSLKQSINFVLFMWILMCVSPGREEARLRFWASTAQSGLETELNLFERPWALLREQSESCIAMKDMSVDVLRVLAQA